MFAPSWRSICTALDVLRWLADDRLSEQNGDRRKGEAVLVVRDELRRAKAEHEQVEEART